MTIQLPWSDHQFFAATRISAAHQAIIDSHNDMIVHFSGSGGACYNHLLDRIEMPHPERFRSQEDFDHVLAHEMLHWARACSRTGQAQFAEASEEIVAELGANILNDTPPQAYLLRLVMVVARRGPYQREFQAARTAAEYLKKASK